MSDTMSDSKFVDVDTDDEELAQLMTETTTTIAGHEHSLVDLLKDIKTAHEEVEQYKNGALTLKQNLKEMRMENEDNELVSEIIEDMEKSAYAVYLRIQRGDQEIIGDRDGEYADYLE